MEYISRNAVYDAIEKYDGEHQLPMETYNGILHAIEEIPKANVREIAKDELEDAYAHGYTDAEFEFLERECGE